MKPRLFIGSSSEGRIFADALQAKLEDDAEVTVWNEGIFRPTEFVLESLLNALDAADIGAFVFAPDDELRIRGEMTPAVRDNVLFELGLFVGRLGRNRSIIVRPKRGEMRIVSDLLGVNPVTFDADRSDHNWEAALGPAATKIRKVIKDLGSSNLPGRSALSPNDLKLLRSAIDPHYPSHTAELAGLPPVGWDDKLCMRYIRLVDMGLAGPAGTAEVVISEKGRAFLARHGT